jgi:hypothetical protein
MPGAVYRSGAEAATNIARRHIQLARMVAAAQHRTSRAVPDWMVIASLDLLDGVVESGKIDAAVSPSQPCSDLQYA